jgi:hypothetical protein
LAAGDQADNESAQPQAAMHVQRQYRQRQADDQEGDQDHGHDRQQRRHRPTVAERAVHQAGLMSLVAFHEASCSGRRGTRLAGIMRMDL